MRTIIVLVCLWFSVSAFSKAPHLILEVKNSNGPGWLTSEIMIDSSGVVTETHLISPPAKQSPPQILTTLTAQELNSVTQAIASLHEGKLIQLDPHQGYNPGGFMSSYILFDSHGRAYTFFKNVSGVDFGLPDIKAQYLVTILKGIQRSL